MGQNAWAAGNAKTGSGKGGLFARHRRVCGSCQVRMLPDPDFQMTCDGERHSLGHGRICLRSETPSRWPAGYEMRTWTVASPQPFARAYRLPWPPRRRWRAGFSAPRMIRRFVARAAESAQDARLGLPAARDVLRSVLIEFWEQLSLRGAWLIGQKRIRRNPALFRACTNCGLERTGACE